MKKRKYAVSLNIKSLSGVQTLVIHKVCINNPTMDDKIDSDRATDVALRRKSSIASFKKCDTLLGFCALEF